MDDFALAVVVNPALSAGLLANTVGTLATGLGSRFPALSAGQVSDQTGLWFDTSSRLPMPVLQADADTLQLLLQRCQQRDSRTALVVYPAFARDIQQIETYLTEVARRDLSAEPLDGIALCGPRKWVRSLTGSLKLLR
ncbi:hypothetical protein A9B99_00705 [Mangrovibacter phragmitis]|uniref:DUF2000 domain-containing protein n=1 Tax=Mangrovibacter phragmitis TaxID=1691903 RepID=A0A1B7L7V5_9ENTR|nr:DUF2000 domain-containing protein [Mangrovibacter phragmitis]OAT78291.1 hypothetical protein A9B99_00705 [Mangrovibacter phragmitis]